MNYKEALQYLETFINYEKKESFVADDLGLERMFLLLEKCGIDPNAVPAIHIAGTKGKGSTAAMLSSVLMESGFKVGLYISPHISNLRERISVNQRVISEADMISSLLEMKAVLEECRDTAYGGVTYFEVLTALAFKYFQDQGLDYIVLETGLGGRLDATNVVKPMLSIITPIALEHTTILGDSLSSVALEKAGIIKKDIPVILAHSEEEAALVLRDKAKQFNSFCYEYGKDFFVENIKFAENGMDFDFCSSMGNMRGLNCALNGEVQAENAGLVCFASLLLKERSVSITGNALYEGLRKVRLLGRFTELEYDGKKYVFDIAHTLESIEKLYDNVKYRYNDKNLTFVFGCSSDKNITAMLGVIEQENRILTSADNDRAANLREYMLDKDIYCDSVNLAICKAKESPADVIIVCGSVFVVAEALACMRVKL